MYFGVAIFAYNIFFYIQRCTELAAPAVIADGSVFLSLRRAYREHPWRHGLFRRSGYDPRHRLQSRR